MHSKIKYLFLIFLLANFNSSVYSQNFQWANKIGGIYSEIGKAIATDAGGNVYTTGNFQGSVDFDPGTGTFSLTGFGNEDIFVSKLDASGNFVWAKQIGGTTYESGVSIALDPSGNIYTTGYFDGTADFDPGPGVFNLSSAGSYDIFISKLDASGNFVWAKSIGSGAVDYSRSIVIDGIGNIFSTGYFTGSVDFDPNSGVFNLTSNGNYDVYVFKLDAAGNFIWAKNMGGPNNDVGHAISLDGSGNAYTTGYFSTTADFDPGASSFNLTCAGTTDVFVSKLDASGNFIWAKGLGGANSEIGTSIAVDAIGNVYTTGIFKGTADFDPGSGVFNIVSSVGSDNIFISKLDASGNFSWAKAIVGSPLSAGQSIALDGLGNVYLTGYFRGTSDFDPGLPVYNLTASGLDDVFIEKLDATGNFVSVKVVGGPSADLGWGISIQGANYIYITGYFDMTCDFDPDAGIFNLTSAGNIDIFIAKYFLSLNANEIDPDNEISIYPNPVTDKLFIELKQKVSGLALCLTDITGREIYFNETENPNKMMVDIAGISNGVYFLKITSGKGMTTRKIVINR